MRVTVFSSNQPRHLNLAREFAQFADTVYFVSEVNTIFPGKVSGFFQKTEVMQDYFSKILNTIIKIGNLYNNKLKPKDESLTL